MADAETIILLHQPKRFQAGVSSRTAVIGPPFLIPQSNEE